MADTVENSDKIVFSDILKLSDLRTQELNSVTLLVNEIYDKRHILKSFGIDVRFKDESITELFSLDGHNKNQ